MGANITCTVNDDLSVSLILPDNFNQDLPFKVFTHGFSSRVYEDDKTSFVEGDNETNTQIRQIVQYSTDVLYFTGHSCPS